MSTVTEQIEATNIFHRIATGHATSIEIDGMMRHTGTDSVTSLLTKLKSYANGRQSIIVSLWALRFTV